jgi:hypothetical protein
VTDMGLLDIFNPPQNPQDMDPNYGVTNQQMYDARMDSIGNMGALLLAAGQKLMPNERAQLLAKLGTVPSQMTQQLDVMSQAQLRAAQAKAAQQQLLMQQNIMKQLGIGGQPAASATAAPATAAGPAIASTATQGATGAPPMNPAQTTLATPPAPVATSNSALANMDPQTRALLLMGAVKDPEAAARTMIENQRAMNELTPVTVTAPNGQVQTLQVPKGQIPQLTQSLQSQGFTIGERKPTGFQNEIDKVDAKNYEGWDQARDQSQILKARIGDMQDAATQFDPGRGASAYMEMAGYLNRAFGTDAFASKEAMGGYDSFVKNSLQLIGAQVKDQEGARAAASLWTMLQKGQPTAETSPEGMKRMFRFMNAIADYNTMKANAADDWYGKYGSLRANGKYFGKEFNDNVDFNKFIGQYLTPSEIATLSDQQKSRYGVQ